jgi:pimeloyl-ACP methyl ester carboxylesterase
LRLLTIAASLLAAGALSMAQTAWVDPSPHTQRFVQVGSGAAVEVLDWGGSGRPLVLLAQLGQTAHIYDEWAPTLARTHRVIGVTRRGYGQSSTGGGFSMEELATDIIRVLDAQDLQGPVLVGNGFAGEEMSWIGSQRPNRTAGLVYLNAAYDRSDVATERVIARRIPSRGGPGPEDLASVQALTRWASSGSGIRIPEAEFRQLAQLAPDGRVLGERASRAVQQQILAEMITTEVDYAAFRVPVLALYATPASSEWLPGCRDAVDSATRLACQELYGWTLRQLETSKRLLDAIPTRPQVVELAGANAFMFLSHPADVTRVLEAFLARLPG